MGFSMQCDNKGCRQYQDPELDMKDSQNPNEWEALCAECGLAITSATYFAKVQMRHMGQLHRPKKQQQAFVVKCGACNKEGRPRLGAGSSLLCFHCGGEHTSLGGPFKQMLLTMLRNGRT
jgi:hypothetical protein